MLYSTKDGQSLTPSLSRMAENCRLLRNPNREFLSIPVTGRKCGPRNISEGLPASCGKTLCSQDCVTENELDVGRMILSGPGNALKFGGRISIYFQVTTEKHLNGC
jgi:hypothetical protein